MGKKAERVLLLGNGLNLLANNHSWEKLLRSLVADNKGKVVVNLRPNFKPFPFVFEELAFVRASGQKSRGFNEELTSLKLRIAEKLGNLQPTEFHRSVLPALPHKVILTTNYDYLIESSLESSFNRLKYRGPKTRERSHSLRRRIVLAGGKTVWHIHGEMGNTGKTTAQSILLGNGHYHSYLAHIHKYLETDHKFVRAIQEDKASVGNSWVDYFFTTDIDIIGFGFDFSETILWWLLNRRAEIIARRRRNLKNNHITYYCQRPVDTDNGMQAKLAKIEVLKSLFVDVRIIAEPDYEKFYQKAFKDVSQARS